MNSNIKQKAHDKKSNILSLLSNKIILITIIIVILFIIPLFITRIYEGSSQQIREAIIDKVQFTVPASKIIGSSIHIGLTSININCEYQSQKLNNQNTEEIIYDKYHLIGADSVKYNNKTKKIMYNFSNNSEINEKSNSQNIKDSLEKINELPKGTKVQVAVYFKESIDIEAAEKYIKDYNIDPNLAWYAINTGSSLTSENIWGFSKLMYTDSKLNLNNLTNCDITFRTKMKNFEVNSKLLNDINLTDEIKSINDYLSKNKTTITGFIAVSKTNNIISLLTNNNVMRCDIISVDFDY